MNETNFRPDFLADAPAHVRGTALWGWQRAIERARTGRSPAYRHFWLAQAGAIRAEIGRTMACPFARRGVVAPR